MGFAFIQLRAVFQRPSRNGLNVEVNSVGVSGIPVTLKCM